MVIHVSISAWLLIGAMLLALFLALAKRRAELVLLEDEASSHRCNLEHYCIAFVDQMTGASRMARPSRSCLRINRCLSISCSGLEVRRLYYTGWKSKE